MTQIYLSVIPVLIQSAALQQVVAFQPYSVQ